MYTVWEPRLLYNGSMYVTWHDGWLMQTVVLLAQPSSAMASLATYRATDLASPARHRLKALYHRLLPTLSFTPVAEFWAVWCTVRRTYKQREGCSSQIVCVVRVVCTQALHVSVVSVLSCSRHTHHPSTGARHLTCLTCP